MKMHKHAVITSVFLLVGIAGGHEEEAVFNDAPMRACIIKNKEVFKTRYETRYEAELQGKIITPSPAKLSAQIGFLERVNDGEEGISVDEWRQELRRITFSFGKLLKEEADIELLVAALYSRGSGIMQFAVDRLMWDVGHGTRKKYLGEIKKALDPCPKRAKEKYLFAKCGLAPEEKKLLLSENSDDLLLRALCGDSSAEAEIISRFKSEIIYYKKERWIESLAFIGTKSCTEALIDGLASPVFMASKGPYPSSYRFIRYPITKVLRVLYEEKEPLFHDLIFLGASQERLNEMDIWVTEEFGHSAWRYKCVIYDVPFFHSGRSAVKFCNCLDKAEGMKQSSGLLKIHSSKSLSSEELGLKDAKVWTVKLGSGVQMDFMRISGGSFEMGSYDFSLDEMPVHKVTIAKPFWLAKTEVTQAQYWEIMGFNPSRVKGDQKPVHQVNREDAVEFCRKLTEQEGKSGRLPGGYEYVLPTEAQWEYACRAGITGDFIENMDAIAWYTEKHSDSPVPHLVGQKQANKWGLHDMLGNVWEWCSDCYHAHYLDAPTNGAKWGAGTVATCEGVVRGGDMAWKTARPALRGWNHTKGSSHYEWVGFRPSLQIIVPDRFFPRKENEGVKSYPTSMGESKWGLERKRGHDEFKNREKRSDKSTLPQEG